MPAESSDRRLKVCLVSMPFTPLLMPSLGLSILKQAAASAGHDCEIYYAAFEWLRLVGVDERPRETLLDYSFIATAEDLGEVLFAPQLWPETTARVGNIWADIPTSPYSAFSTDDTMLMVARLSQLTRKTPEFFERCLRARDWGSYDVIGFSTTFAQNLSSLCLSRRIKQKFPQSRIIFGGANCDGEMGAELLRSFPWIDHVLSGEADLTFPEYLAAVAASAPVNHIAGLQWRDPLGQVTSVPARFVNDLAVVPEPDFSDYFAQAPDHLNLLGSITLPIELSRGCWWGAVQHCVFCGLNPTGLTYRSRTPSEAVAALLGSAARWGIRDFTLVDNILDLDYVSSVLPQLRGAGLSIFAETKSNLKEHQVAMLAQAGVSTIQPGVESLNTATLKHMRKGARAMTQLELLKWCRTYSVRTLWFYLYGFPREQARWYRDDIALMPRLVHLPPPGNPNPVVIDRFSPLYQRPTDYGLSNLRPAWNADLIYAGLDERARFRLAYHFDADSEHSVIGEYEPELWAAVDAWQRAYHAGAYLTQQVGDQTTLISDGRDPGHPKHYLLGGCVHFAYSALRTSLSEEGLAAAVSECFEPGCELTPKDLKLTIQGMQLGASMLGSDSDQDWSAAEALAAVCAALDAAALVARVDGRLLALAVDADPAFDLFESKQAELVRS